MSHRALVRVRTALTVSAVLASAFALPVAAQNVDPDTLAKQLSNPVAALISMPFQLNYDTGYGSGDDRWTLNIQPVVPISVSEDWNLISRTILPVVSQGDSGLGDTVQSLFFSHKEPTASGWILGAGPVFLLPTGSKGFSQDQWAAGPTIVALRQAGSWTYGVLANHLWGISNNGTHEDVDTTFVQPFLAKATGGGATFSVNFEATHDWKGRDWTLPLNLIFTKVTRVGPQLLSVGGGARVYLDAPPGGADWGLRGVVTLLFPK
jgi:hypothetical protein